MFQNVHTHRSSILFIPLFHLGNLLFLCFANSFNVLWFDYFREKHSPKNTNTFPLEINIVSYMFCCFWDWLVSLRPGSLRQWKEKSTKSWQSNTLIDLCVDVMDLLRHSCFNHFCSIQCPRFVQVFIVY